jgi:hypothetical protein
VADRDEPEEERQEEQDAQSRGLPAEARLHRSRQGTLRRPDRSRTASGSRPSPRRRRAC